MRAALFAIFVFTTAAAGCSGNTKPGPVPPSSQSSLLGKPAPDFKRDALDGSKFELGASKGKVVVVKFVAKYCEPCMKTLPAIEKLHKDHPDVTVVAISEDEHEAEARELVTKFSLTFPVVHDRQQVLSGRYHVRDLPVTYVLDGKGVIAWVGGPEKTERDLVAAIEGTKP
jgi:cytochrome c biogenesis protein CcmG, thiol:disulfide interchange protein DsbE